MQVYNEHDDAVASYGDISGRVWVLRESVCPRPEPGGVLCFSVFDLSV